MATTGALMPAIRAVSLVNGQKSEKYLSSGGGFHLPANRWVSVGPNKPRGRAMASVRQESAGAPAITGVVLTMTAAVIALALAD
jgi:hypothetical protein